MFKPTVKAATKEKQAMSTSCSRPPINLLAGSIIFFKNLAVWAPAASLVATLPDSNSAYTVSVLSTQSTLPTKSSGSIGLSTNSSTGR